MPRPGCLRRNHSTLRYEAPENLLEVRVLIEDWRMDYNINRPHSAHGDLSPTEFAAKWNIKQPQAA